MPQSNVQVSEVDLRSDMRSYYRGSCVTYKGQCALVNDFTGGNENLKAQIHLLSPDGEWGDVTTVLASNLDFTMPELGYVEMGNTWVHLSRVPARRMRKGYHHECIRMQFLSDPDVHVEVNSPQLLKQVWYGNTNRLNADAVIFDNKIYFQQDVVANIKGGKVVLVEGKEKIGEYVCKLLASNWEFHSSKHSLLPLDL